MAYNGFPATYNPYYAYQQNYQPVQSQNNGLIWVQGEGGAKSYNVPTNGTVLLMDSESDQFYLKSVDASGMPLPLRTFKYSEVISQPKNESKHTVDDKTYVTHDEFEKFKREMEKIMKKEEENEQLTL